MNHPFAPLGRAFADRDVRYVLIGVSGANMYAPANQPWFVTEDFGLFLPGDALNLLHAWQACEAANLEVWLSGEPLDRPRDSWLAEEVLTRRALTRIRGPDDLIVDLTLVMKGFDFDTAWAGRRVFTIEGVDVLTARLMHIVTSKQAAGRPKDQLFLATHKDAIEQLLEGGS